MSISAFVQVLLPVIVAVAYSKVLYRGVPIDLRSPSRVCIYILSPALTFVTPTLLCASQCASIAPL